MMRGKKKEMSLLPIQMNIEQTKTGYNIPITIIKQRLPLFLESKDDPTQFPQNKIDPKSKQPKLNTSPKKKRKRDEPGSSFSPPPKKRKKNIRTTKQPNTQNMVQKSRFEIEDEENIKFEYLSNKGSGPNHTRTEDEQIEYRKLAAKYTARRTRQRKRKKLNKIDELFKIVERLTKRIEFLEKYPHLGKVT